MKQYTDRLMKKTALLLAAMLALSGLGTLAEAPENGCPDGVGGCAPQPELAEEIQAEGEVPENPPESTDEPEALVPETPESESAEQPEGETGAAVLEQPDSPAPTGPEAAEGTGADEMPEEPETADEPEEDEQQNCGPQAVSLTLNVGACYTAKPEGAVGKLTWSTDNAKTATVSASGRITARAVGTACIAATQPDGIVFRFAVTVVQPATGVTVTGAKTVNTGGSIRLTAAVKPATATDKTVQFTSGDPALAAVDEDGIVTGLLPGTVIITAETANGKKASIRIKVVQPAESVALSENALEIQCGKSVRLTATVLPDNTTDKKVKWISSDTKVATVTAAGVVYGKAGGDCVITATAASGVQATAAIKVIQHASSLTLKADAKTINVGESTKISAAVKPITTTDQTVTYASGNAAIAQVSEYGTVTGNAPGTVTITGMTENGRKATMKITVVQPVERVELSGSQIAIFAGKTAKIAAAVYPENATDKKLKWTSSNTKTAVVSASGVITAKAGGECIITATAASGVCAEIAVTVEQPVTSVKLTVSDKTIARGESRALTCTVSPATATHKEITWTSSDERIASVSEDGVVTGLSDGTVTITAAATSGKKASVVLKVVTIPVKGATMGGLFVTLNPGDTRKLNASVVPANATDRALRFSSSDPDAVTVSDDGTVTAVSTGRAVITAVSANGMKASCTVSVIEPGMGRLSGLVIGVNPGHQAKGDTRQEPIAPGSSQTSNRINVGTAGVSSGVAESIVNLQVALKLKAALEAEGAVVVITRETNDVDIGNLERAVMLNEAGVDIALQLHCNGSANRSANGISIYSRKTGVNLEESAAMAAILMDAMRGTTGARNAGIVKADKYKALNYALMPAVLIEMGYMTNSTEDRKLVSDDYQMLLVQGMLNGICQYFDR